MHDQDTTERWRSVPGYEGYYEVSDQGRVRSVTRRVKTCRRKDGEWATRLHAGRTLTACTPRGGYPTVLLWRQGAQESLRVHTAVLAAFVGPRAPGQECRHLDSDKENNRLANLAWGTVSENQMDRVDAGTSNRGERNGQAKLTARDVLSIRRRRGRHTQRQIADEYGVTPGCIQGILSRKNWAWLED